MMDMLLVSDGLGHFYDLLAMLTPPGGYQTYSFDFLGVQLQQVPVPVASTGGTLRYDDGGEPAGG